MKSFKHGDGTTRIYVLERSDKLTTGKTESREATVEILAGNEDGLNFLNFSSGMPFSFLLVFLLLCGYYFSVFSAVTSDLVCI